MLEGPTKTAANKDRSPSRTPQKTKIRNTEHETRPRPVSVGIATYDSKASRDVKVTSDYILGDQPRCNEMVINAKIGASTSCRRQGGKQVIKVILIEWRLNQSSPE